MDESKQDTGYIVLRKPVSNQKLWDKVRRKYSGHILAMSSSHSFPIKHTHFLDSCIGLCHCFRDSNRVQHKISKELISRSDFTNPDKIIPVNAKKEYDFAYICLPSQCKYKNYDWLIQSLLPILCNKIGLRGLFIGLSKNHVPEEYKTNIDVVSFQDQPRFFEYISKCRFIFLPQVNDASPRVLTESLCLNVPVIVNWHILGGWKYINEHTGAFFYSERDLEQIVESVLNNKYAPRQWFEKNYGPIHAGKKLLNFIRKVQPKSLPKNKYVLLQKF